ncbi:hypothetical protein AB0H83_44105 [Dactylosporangium sp. NPDC050688]|uniref:DISARM anti-phage system protein DrmE domain-containing protein n=1 Tax=Dactylosporangium sp. NPDC050688 TaxID=3157217 RepID=UPI0033C091CE
MPLFAAGLKQALEFVVDAVPYGTADDGCPSVPLPPAIGVGISSCLNEGRLSSDGRPVDTSVFDVDALRAVEHAIARRGSVLVCPADPLAPVSALIAATVHVDAMVRGLLESGRPAGSKLRVGVVTADHHLRGFYRGLAVAGRPGGSSVPMRSVVPAATVGRTGMLNVIDRDDGRWSTVFVDSVEAARQLGELDLLIVDLPVNDANSLSGIGLPVVIVARDPSDPVALRMARHLPTFGYDWGVRAGIALETLETTAGAGAARLINRMDRRIRVVPVVAPQVCSDAGLFWNDIGSVLRLAGRSHLLRTVAGDAFALFHDLIGLAMPIDEFERSYGRPFASRVADLAQAAGIVARGELRDEWLPMVEAELSGVLSSLRRAERDGPAAAEGYTTKASVLPPLLAEALDKRQDVLVVTRTAVFARVYTQYLSQRWPQVRVASIGELATTRPADVAVLLGMAPTWARWVYRSGVGRELAVLAYTGHTPTSARSPGERSSADFDEAAVVIAAVNMQGAADQGISAPDQRARAWAALSSGCPEDGGYLHRRSGGNDSGLTVSSLAPPEVPPGLWDGGKWTADIEPNATSTSRSISGSGRAETAPGLRVTFTDGTWAWLHAHSFVWCWRAYSNQGIQVEARQLVAGDDLVLIDGDAHKTLLTKVLEVSSGIPELAVASAWVDYWRTALGRARALCGSYAALDRRLAVLGCRVQTQTVRLWCVGSTIGPEDSADIRRVGELLDDHVLLTRQPEISRAMRTLRHSHGRLQRRLASMVRSAGPAAANGRLRPDEVLDEASGLTAADIETAVIVVTVASVEVVDAVPRVLAGRRHDADEPPDLIHAVRDEEQQ